MKAIDKLIEAMLVKMVLKVPRSKVSIWKREWFRACCSGWHTSPNFDTAFSAISADWEPLWDHDVYNHPVAQYCSEIRCWRLGRSLLKPCGLRFLVSCSSSACRCWSRLAEWGCNREKLEYVYYRSSNSDKDLILVWLNTGTILSAIFIVCYGPIITGSSAYFRSYR